METNLNSLLYLFFRLSPFIVVSFFTLSSIINNEVKGFVYIVGLCFGLVLLSLFGSLISNIDTVPDSKLICHSLPFGNASLPIGIGILAYTLGYLLFTIVKYKIVVFNLAIVILFPMLILADVWWNISTGCYTTLKCIVSLIVGGGSGVLWSYIIWKSKVKEFQYYNIGSASEICSKPSAQTFKCAVYKNGKLIKSHMKSSS
jgi:hypothetical protein